MGGQKKFLPFILIGVPLDRKAMKANFCDAGKNSFYRKR
jgi:hypothetical protein